MRAGVGEARLGPRAGQQLAHDLGAVVAVAGGPFEFVAVLAGQLEEGIHRVQTALAADVLEIAPDHRGVRALAHPAVGEIAVPQAEAEGGLDVLLEALAEGRVLDARVELLRVLDVAQHFAGAELLEAVHVQPLDAHHEGRWQGLPAIAAAQQAVGDPAGGTGDTVHEGLGLEVQRGEHRALQRPAEPAVGLVEEGEHVDLGDRVGRALHQRVAPAQHGEQAGEFLPAGESGGQRAGPGAVAVHLVQARGHHRQAETAGIQSLLQQLFHALQLGFGGLGAADGALKPHDCHAQLGVAEEGAEVRSQWLLVVEGAIALGVLPGALVTQDRQHLLARHGLDAGEQVGTVLGLAQHHADGAGTNGDGGHTVAYRLLQRRGGDGFGVVVRVDFQEAWGDPAAAGVDDLWAAAFVERADAQGVDAPILDADVAQAAGGVAAVEVEAVLDDDVVAHRRLQGDSSRMPLTSSRQWMARRKWCSSKRWCRRSPSHTPSSSKGA